MNMPQVTYAEEILSCENSTVTVKRRLEHGVETVSCALPLVVTVHGSAAPCRPRNAKCLMKFKHARTMTEWQELDADYCANLKGKDFLNITEWGVSDVGGDEQQFGLSGSPTKVKKIENIVFQAKESKKLTAADKDIDELMGELIANHTIG
jgi:electron transfer flavoprotein beta subunit